MNKSLLWIIVAVVVIAGGVAVANYLNQPDDRNAIQRVGDAAEKLPDLGQAGEQLEDRTPGQKIGDAVEEATDGDGK